MQRLSRLPRAPRHSRRKGDRASAGADHGQRCGVGRGKAPRNDQHCSIVEFAHRDRRQQRQQLLPMQSTLIVSLAGRSSSPPLSCRLALED